MNIVFDLGGVVVSWRPQALIAGFSADPVVQDRVRTQILGHADWIELDRGALLQPDAVVRAAQRTGLSEAAVGEFFRQVPLALVAVPDTVELLYRLNANGQRLFCLSNMHPAFIEHLEKAYTFWDTFHGIVISCRLGLCKPEPGIYRHLLDTYGLCGTDTVFIDDTPENLTAAAAFGIRTILFENTAQCERQLQALGCI